MAEIINSFGLSNGDVLTAIITKDRFSQNTSYNFDTIRKFLDFPMITPRFRIYVLYSDETINYEIPVEDIKLGGSYSENYQNGQRRSLSFALDNFSGKYTPNINTLWAGTRLRLDQGIEMYDGTTVWFYKGIYVISQVTPSQSINEKTVQVSASDKFSLFEGRTGALESTFEIPVDSEIEKVIQDILLSDMGNGDPMDTKPIVYHESFKGKRTQATITKSAGETYGSILLELATQLSAEIFYNSMGNLVLLPMSEILNDEDKSIIYHYYSEKGDINGLNFTFDMNSIVNRVIVIGSSQTGGTHHATAVNDDPASPLCYQRIGYRTGEIINDSNIYTDLLAQERAQYELRQKLILRSSTSVNVSFNPLLMVNNMITITDDFFNFSQERFLIQSISTPLDYSGQSSISISNARNLPFVVK